MAEALNAWDQQEKEPNLWFGRFLDYRNKGPGRTLLGVYNEYRARKGMALRLGMSGSWTTMASKWKWKNRAEAWDNKLKEPLDEDMRRASRELMDHVNQSVKVYYGKLVARLRTLKPEEIPVAQLGPQLLAFAKTLKEIHGAANEPLAGDEEIPLADVDVRALAVQRRRDAQQLERFKTERGLSVTPESKVLTANGGSSRAFLGNGNTVPAPTNGDAKVDSNPRAALTPRVKNRAVEGNGSTNGV